MKRIIILKASEAWPGQTTISFLMRADVPQKRQVKNTQSADYVSAYVESDPADVDAIKAGQIAEKTSSINVPSDTQMDVIQKILMQEFNKYQDEVTNDQSLQIYGTSFDGATWTVGGL